MALSAGAIVIFTPVCGFFLSLKLVTYSVRAWSPRAEQARRKWVCTAAVWAMCISALVACNLCEPGGVLGRAAAAAPVGGGGGGGGGRNMRGGGRGGTNGGAGGIGGVTDVAGLTFRVFSFIFSSTGLLGHTSFNHWKALRYTVGRYRLGAPRLTPG